MIEVKTIRRPNLSYIIDMDLSEELNFYGNAVKGEIVKNYRQSKDFQGNPLKPLAPSTVESKKNAKAGKRYTEKQAQKVRQNASKPLVATENMMFNQKIHKATQNRQVCTLTIGPTRAEIYGYQHSTRKPWGITKTAIELGDKAVEAKIGRLLRKVGNA